MSFALQVSILKIQCTYIYHCCPASITSSSGAQWWNRICDVWSVAVRQLHQMDPVWVQWLDVEKPWLEIDHYIITSLLRCTTGWRVGLLSQSWGQLDRSDPSESHCSNKPGKLSDIRCVHSLYTVYLSHQNPILESKMEGNYPSARGRERGKTLLGWLGCVAMLL